MKNFLSQSFLFENIQILLSWAIVSPNIGSKFKAYQEKGIRKFKYMLKFSLLTTTKGHIVEFFHINLYIISLLRYRLSWKQNVQIEVFHWFSDTVFVVDIVLLISCKIFCITHLYLVICWCIQRNFSCNK